jgi:hypothetical protein
MTSHKEFKCIDCQKDTWNEYYMLYSHVWKKANPEIKGKLCIACVEKRLRRNLTSKDFTKALVNTEKTKRTIKLQNRING